MKKTHDQAAFYRLLARLLWYLASGKSHVGYLSNCPRNPFVAKDVSPFPCFLLCSLLWFSYHIPPFVRLVFLFVFFSCSVAPPFSVAIAVSDI